MQVVRSGNLYKASRITGPKHNFLGLELGSEKPAHGLKLEELSVDRRGDEPRKLRADQVVLKVLEGVALANESLGAAYQVQTVQFVPSDSGDLNAYVILAQRITEEVAGGAAGTEAKSRGGAVA